LVLNNSRVAAAMAFTPVFMVASTTGANMFECKEGGSFFVRIGLIDKNLDGVLAFIKRTLGLLRKGGNPEKG